MSFFNLQANRISSVGNYTIEAAEGYNGEYGAQRALCESYENDLAIFTGLVRHDVVEFQAMKEGASEESVTALTEAASDGFFGRIVDFLKKVWEKIKGIFKNFIAKFDSLMMSEKAFHDKYQKVVYGKELGKMKTKYSKEKKAIPEWGNLSSGGATPNKFCLDFVAINPKIDELVENFDEDEFKCNITKEAIALDINDFKDFDKEFHEYCFDDEEEKDGCNDIIDTMGGILVNASKTISTLKKSGTALEKDIADFIKKIEAQRNGVIKKLPTESDTKASHTQYGSFGKNDNGKYVGNDKATPASGTNKNANKILNYIYRQLVSVQAVIGKYTAACMRETKFKVAQAKRIFAQAVTYSPKNEAFALVAGESAEYELMSEFARF